MTHSLAVVASLVLAAQTPPPPDAPAPATTTAPAAAERCKIVVLNLVGRALIAGDEDLPAILTETLANEIGVVSGCDVVSQADIIAMLDYERQKAVCTDGSDSCLAEVGQALGADRVVAGTVAKLGTEFILAARLMNVKKGAVEMRAEEPVAAGAQELRRAAKNVGRRLFGAKDLPSTAKVDDTPLTKGPPPPPDDGLPTLFWAGGVVAAVGLAAAVVGGTLAALADARLGDPQEVGKEDIAVEGQVALATAAAGGVVAVGGIGLAAVAMMGE